MWVIGLVTSGFKALLSLFGWYKANRDVEAGKIAQAEADLKQSLELQQRQEVAAAQAPKTEEELQNKLKDGTF